jgi:TatD DNase family protein
LYSFYNIHSHQINQETDILTILNQYSAFGSCEKAISIGLHPWHLDTTINEWDNLRSKANDSNVLAIGECGLDRLCTTPWNLQIEYFQKQIQLANELHKPLIIHCVRAYSEVFELLKTSKVPIIFHGFNKNLQIASQILNKGYFLSFGAAIMHQSTALHTVLKQVPAHRLLLETDNATHLSIKDIYNKAAFIRSVGIEQLQLSIQQNFDTIFAP